MPYIDYAADIKITIAPGTVTAEIPLAGRASEHWVERFRTLASESSQELPLEVEAADREDRTWVIVRLPATSTDPHSESTMDAIKATMDAVKALISQANRPEARTQVVGAETAFVIRGWWELQKQEQPGHRSSNPLLSRSTVLAGMLDEGLDAIMLLWSGEAASFHGRYVTVDEVIMRPAPVQQPRVPIWVGGTWPIRGPARRAAR